MASVRFAMVGVLAASVMCASVWAEGIEPVAIEPFASDSVTSDSIPSDSAPSDRALSRASSQGSSEPVLSPMEPSHLQAELDRMQRQIDELMAASSSASTVPPPSSASAPWVTAARRVCCPSAKPQPKFPTARLTGFFQADSVWFDQDAGNIAAVGNIQDGADFRRARLAATGQAWDNISYMLEMDFAAIGRPSFMDVWLEIDEAIGSSRLRIGQFRQPLGMDGQTSVKELTFLERATPFAFLPFRQIGAMLHGTGSDELSTWAIAVFRYPTDSYGGNVGDNGGYGMATRMTGLLIDRGDGNGLLHVGGGYSYINPANDQFRYRNQPEVSVQETGGGVPAGTMGSVPPFVDTGDFAANNANMFNFELAGSLGSVYAQSEVFYAVVNRPDTSSLTLPGAYVHAGYFLTGETRAYHHGNGVFGRVTPHRSVGKQGGIGAWEIAARYSYIDLNDDDIQGGRLNNLTAGLNWYWNPHTKFQFNYIRAKLDDPTDDHSDANIYAVRAQIDF